MAKIVRWDTGAVIFEGTGTVRDVLEEAVRQGVNLFRASLDGARLVGAWLDRASLDGARLVGAWLDRASLDGARLDRASLDGARLDGARLVGARLVGASLPDGRLWELYRLDPLAGICDTPEARERAVGAWASHQWGTCPMSAANGYQRVQDAPEAMRIAVAAFVALFDSHLLPLPTGPVDVGGTGPDAPTPEA